MRQQYSGMIAVGSLCLFKGLSEVIKQDDAKPTDHRLNCSDQDETNHMDLLIVKLHHHKNMFGTLTFRGHWSDTLCNPCKTSSLTPAAIYPHFFGEQRRQVVNIFLKITW